MGRQQAYDLCAYAGLLWFVHAVQQEQTEV